jgi:hypothetical protein
MPGGPDILSLPKDEGLGKVPQKSYLCISMQ